MENMYRPGGKDYLHVNDEKVLKIDSNYIESLKTLAQRTDSRKCTMCLHNDIRAHVHEMLNVYPKEIYIRPHSHPFKTESRIIIEGKLLVVIFDEEGEIVDLYAMEKSGIIISRIDKGIIHTNIPLTDVVYEEVIEGPFVGKDDSVFPQWAPELDDKNGISQIMDKIYQRWERGM